MSYNQVGHPRKGGCIGRGIGSALDKWNPIGGGPGGAIGACPITRYNDGAIGEDGIRVSSGDIVKLPIVIFIGGKGRNGEAQCARLVAGKSIEKWISVLIICSISTAAGNIQAGGCTQRDI